MPRATVAEARTRARTTHVRILTSLCARQHPAVCLALLLARAAQMAVRTRAHSTLHYPPTSVILESLPVPRRIQGFSLGPDTCGIRWRSGTGPADAAGCEEGTADRIRRRHWLDGHLLLRPIPCHRRAPPAASARGSARRQSARERPRTCWDEGTLRQSSSPTHSTRTAFNATGPTKAPPPHPPRAPALSRPGARSPWPRLSSSCALQLPCLTINSLESALAQGLGLASHKTVVTNVY